MLYIKLPDTKTIKKRNAISTSDSEFMLISLFAYYPNDKGAPEIAHREVKKLGRQLQRELRIKRELCVTVTSLAIIPCWSRCAKIDVSTLSFALHEWFSCKGKERKIYCSELALSSESQKGAEASTTTTATKTPQICIFDNEKQYFCTHCTCIFHLLTF